MRMKKTLKKYYNFSVKKHLIIIFCISLIIRISISFIAYKHKSHEIVSDNTLYLAYTNTLINEGVNFEPFHPLCEYTSPGIAILSYPIVYLFNSNWLMIFIFISIIGSLTPIMIFLIAIKIFNKSSAILAALWGVFYIQHLKFIPTMGKEIWMSLFMLLNVYFIILLTDKIRERGVGNQLLIFVTSTFVLAFSILFDERFIVFLLIYPVLILFLTKPFSNGLRNAFVYLILVIIFLLPWNIRNYQRYDKVVLLTKRTEHITDKLFGYENRNGNLMNEYFDTYGYEYIHDYQIDSVISGKITETDGGAEIHEAMRKAMKNGFLPHPLKWHEQYWSRFREFWRPVSFSGKYLNTGYYFNGKWSLRHNLSTMASYGVLLPFFILGLFRLLKREKKVFTILFMTIFVYCFIHVATVGFTVWRYRVPLDSLIILIAFYYISDLINRFNFFPKSSIVMDS
jgi:hypothetical protein